MRLLCVRDFIVTAIIGLVVSSPLLAFRFQSSDEIYLSGDIQEDLMLAGGTVNFDGNLYGDLLAASRTISFDGMIDGNLNAVGQRIAVNGEICRSLRAFAQSLNVSSRVEGDMVAFASEVTLGSDAEIGRDLAAFGTEVYLDGVIGSDAYVYANIVTVTGRIEGDLKISANKISIAPGAYVGGDFNYESKTKAKISAESQILGETRWKKRTSDSESSGIVNWIPPPGGILWSIVFFVGSILMGILVILISRGAVHSVVDEIRTNGAVSGFLGLAIVALMPVLIVLTGITLLGLPVALAGITVYALFFFIGKVFASIALGAFLLGLVRKGKKISLGWSLVLGMLILALLFKIPVLGWFIYLGAWSVGVGAIVIRIFRKKTPAVAEAVAVQ